MSTMNVIELKVEVKERNLRITGQNTELAVRLILYLQTSLDWGVPCEVAEHPEENRTGKEEAEEGGLPEVGGASEEGSASKAGRLLDAGESLEADRVQEEGGTSEKDRSLEAGGLLEVDKSADAGGVGIAVDGDRGGGRCGGMRSIL